MSNKTYDVLKLIALLIGPIIIFATSMLTTWGAPYQEEIIKSLAAFEVLVGALVAAAKQWYDSHNND